MEIISLTLIDIMIIDKVLEFFDHFPQGMYIKTIAKPMIHGFFDEREQLSAALKELEENDKQNGTNTTLYFMANKLKDISKLPHNEFQNILKNQGVKKKDVAKLKYLLIDIDPKDKKEMINGEVVDKNLTVQEHQIIIQEGMSVRDELINNGFTNVGLISSGNGVYIILPFKNLSIDSLDVLKNFVRLLDKQVELEHSTFDIKTITPEHIFKIPGTLSTKGVETEDNPYRHAEILEDWNHSTSCNNEINNYITKYDNTYSNNKLIYYSSDSSAPFLDVKKCIKEFEKIFPVYFGGNHDYYIRIPRDNIFKDILISSGDFKRELRNYIRNVTGEDYINFDGLNTIAMHLSDMAYKCDPAIMASRAYYDCEKNKVYYDICNQKDVVEISQEEIKIIPKPLGMFSQYLTDRKQVMYEPTPASELPQLLKQVTTLKKDNLYILATYLCICCMGKFFPMPFLGVVGNKGSSKSTLTGMIQDIVHPQTTSLFTLTGSEENLAIALSSRLLTCFDNISGVKSSIADLLCSAVTGGAYHKRELYTTADERIIPYKSIIVVNGLDIVSKRTDLMERCVLLELEPISPEKRKTEKEVETVFKKILPEIMGAIFDAIQKVITMPDLELKHLRRMADYEHWSCKFAVAMGCCTAEEFQEILKENENKVIDAVSFGDPTVYAIVEFMRGKSVHVDGIQAFYVKCVDILRAKATEHELKLFPQGPSSFSRKISSLEQNLKAYGITTSKVNIGPNKELTITNDGTVIPNNTTGTGSNKLVYEKEEEEKI